MFYFRTHGLIVGRKFDFPLISWGSISTEYEVISTYPSRLEVFEDTLLSKNDHIVELVLEVLYLNVDN